MAVTLTKVRRIVEGNSVRITGSVTGPASYTTGGETLSTAQIRLLTDGEAAVAGKKIRVYAVFVSSVDAKTVQWTDAVGGTALTGAVPCAVNGGYVLPHNPAGWFETSAGNALGLSLGAATGVAGVVTYALV